MDQLLVIIIVISNIESIIFNEQALSRLTALVSADLCVCVCDCSTVRHKFQIFHMKLSVHQWGSQLDCLSTSTTITSLFLGVICCNFKKKRHKKRQKAEALDVSYALSLCLAVS